MLSFPLFKFNFKANLLLLIFFSAVLAAGMFAVFQMDSEGHASADFLSFCLREFIFCVIPSIYSLIASNRLVTKLVRRGTMSYFMSTGNPRGKIIFTQVYYLIVSLLILFILVGGLGIVTGIDQFIGDCGAVTYLLLTLGGFAFSIFISSICFLVSCMVKETSAGLSIGGGILGVFYVIHLLSNMSSQLEVLKYATFFSLFNSEGILREEFYALILIPVLLIIGIVLYYAGIKIFKKRDLPL